MKVKVSQTGNTVVTVGVQGPSGPSGADGVAGITNISDAIDVDITNLQNGAVLVYNTNTNKWTSTITFDAQNLEGGEF